MSRTWFTIVLPIVTALVLGAGLAFLVRQQAAVRRREAPRVLVEPGLDAPLTPTRRPPPRPWWTNPFVWIGVSVVCTLLGIFVVPGFFGGTFLFLPFIFVRRAEDETPDPRSNGHGTVD